jgi:3'(2'), 5'-bisphosphate nucleotidase
VAVNPSITHNGVLTETQISTLYALAHRAGQAILEVYRDERLWQASEKSDNTPVTAADIRSSDILVSSLAEVINCPVVSEEALPSYQERSKWPLYWLVDPLDGTREFLHKTGEFVINIALMHNHQPIFGFIYQPTIEVAWWGGMAMGAYSGKPGNVKEIKPMAMAQPLIAVGSRRSKWQGEWREKLEAQGYEVSTQAVGSALKFARLACGEADLYPRLGPTCEWDTAAPQAILDATGGAIRQWDGKPLEYGKKDVLNPHFIAVGNFALLKTLV